MTPNLSSLSRLSRLSRLFGLRSLSYLFWLGIGPPIEPPSSDPIRALENEYQLVFLNLPST